MKLSLSAPPPPLPPPPPHPLIEPPPLEVAPAPYIEEAPALFELPPEGRLSPPPSDLIPSTVPGLEAKLEATDKLWSLEQIIVIDSIKPKGLFKNRFPDVTFVYLDNTFNVKCLWRKILISRENLNF